MEKKKPKRKKLSDDEADSPGQESMDREREPTSGWGQLPFSKSHLFEIIM